jgi:hypothetical protein
MKKIFIILMVVLASCHTEYKECKFTHSDIETAIYNDILIQIVEQYSYNAYLGKAIEKFRNEFMDEAISLEKYRFESMKLQNKLFGDSINFCTIYIRDTCKESFRKKHYFGIKGYKSVIDTIVSKVSGNIDVVDDTLRQLQENLNFEKFHACTFNIKSFSKVKREELKAGLGVICFSKLFLNKNKDAGLLIYENIDEGSEYKWRTAFLIYYKKKGVHWKIIDTFKLGIS